MNFWKITFLMTFLFSFIIGDDVCQYTAPCKCVFSNGTGIDISPSTTSTFYSVTSYTVNNTDYTMSTYFFHPCSDISVTTNVTGRDTSCLSGPLSVYRETRTVKLTPPATYMINSTCDFLGKTTDSKFTNDGKSIVFNNGPAQSLVYLVCADTTGDLVVSSENDEKNIVLIYYSNEACLKQFESGRSTGSTMLIIFLCFVIFYLVLGVCTKKFLMGATGIEVIPNLSFWSDLPNLVKEGWIFAISGCRLPTRGPGVTTASDPNSYDSI